MLHRRSQLTNWQFTVSVLQVKVGHCCVEIPLEVARSIALFDHLGCGMLGVSDEFLDVVDPHLFW